MTFDFLGLGGEKAGLERFVIVGAIVWPRYLRRLLRGCAVRPGIWGIWRFLSRQERQVKCPIAENIKNTGTKGRIAQAVCKVPHQRPPGFVWPMTSVIATRPSASRRVMLGIVVILVKASYSRGSSRAFNLGPQDRLCFKKGREMKPLEQKSEIEFNAIFSDHFYIWSTY